MKIKILTSCAGNFFSFRQGETVEADLETARDLIAAGFAEEVKAAAKPKAGAKKDDNA